MSETLREVFRQRIREHTGANDLDASVCADEILSALRAWEPSEAVCREFIDKEDASEPLVVRELWRALLDAAIKEG